MQIPRKKTFIFILCILVLNSCNRFLNNNKVHSKENKNKEEELFIEAFYSKDYNKMKSLIDAGININAIKAGSMPHKKHSSRAGE